MGDKELKRDLRQTLGQGTTPERMEETVQLCVGIVQKQRGMLREARTNFWQYLSDVFRFEGMLIFGLQALVLLFACLTVTAIADVPENIPVFMPLFVLAVVPAVFKSQYYGMSELEAVTRASNAQIVLARLILAGAANLICMTVLLCLEVSLQNSGKAVGQMILYCLVPYLVCMSVLLRLVRLQKKDGAAICIVVMAGICACFGISKRAVPGMYETSATGVWFLAFWVFSVFFAKELHYVLVMRKEGKMYGIIA